MTVGVVVHRRSGAVLLFVASGACAGLILASQGLADFVRRPRLSLSSVPAGAEPHAAPRTGAMFSDIADEQGAFADTRRHNLAGSRRGEIRGYFATRTRDQLSAAAPWMLSTSLEPQTYSMAAPEFLSDPAAAVARSIAVGDVSGDGRDDLVFLSVHSAPNPIENRTEIYAAYQRNDGRLDAAVKIAESGNNLAYQLLVADLDRDGVSDIVTATVDGVMLLHSNADGSFTTSTTVVGDPHDLIVTDVDRDGYLDVLVDASNTHATVIHGNGRGVIDRVSTLPLPSSAVRTTGDVTGDGLDDLILATIFNRPLEEFRIYPAIASGGYSAPVVLSLPLGSNMTASLAAGDFNGDGRGDLALDEGKDYANLRLYFQDAQGHLASNLEIARQRGASTESLLATDLNRDGRTDLAIAHSGWGYIGYYLQTGSAFTPETVIDAYQYQGRANYFAAGDLNHDGCGDLVVARASQSPVLLYGQGCAHALPTADCRLPAYPVEGSGIEAASVASSLVRQDSRDIGANARESDSLRPNQPVRRR